MKKSTVLITFFVFASLGVYAQFEQGSGLIGGSFNARFNGHKTKSGSTTTTNWHSSSIGFGPQGGYFVVDKFALGAGITLQSSTVKDEASSDKETTTSVVFSPFLRYYLDQGIFFQGRFDVGSSKSKDQFGNNTNTFTSGLTGLALSAGYAWFLNDNVALEPQIGYGSLTSKSGNSNVKSIEGGVFILAGFQIYLRK